MHTVSTASAISKEIKNFFSILQSGIKNWMFDSIWSHLAKQQCECPLIILIVLSMCALAYLSTRVPQCGCECHHMNRVTRQSDIQYLIAFIQGFSYFFWRTCDTLTVCIFFETACTYSRMSQKYIKGERVYVYICMCIYIYNVYIYRYIVR